MTLSGGPLPDAVPVHKILSAGLSRDGDATALASRTINLSFRQIETASDRLAAQYAAIGIRPGDRIASLMPNRAALIIHYLACFKGAFVAVPLNYRYTPREIDHALEKSGCAAIFHHVEREDDMLASKVGAAGLPHGHILYGYEEGVDGVHFERLIEEDVTAEPAPREEDAPAMILFTSGSTGPAKGVTHTFRSLAAMMASVAAALAYAPGERVLAASSLSHLGAFLFSFGALAVGGSAVIARNTGAGEILGLLRRERPDVLAMLPASLFGLIRDPDARREDFASLRLLRSGSDKVPSELHREFEALTGLPIHEGYGCTELGNALINPANGAIRVGSIGKSVPGVALKVRDTAGNELGAGEDGILWGRSEGLMRGYWDDDAATAAVFEGDWFNTGDLVRCDPDGYFWFRGRVKQIIVHDGSNIFPQEVEDALLAHPRVASAGVIGIHDLLHGENVRAYVVAKAGTAPSADALIEFARERVGYKAPEEIVFLTEMPLNPTGKVDRARLKRLADSASQ